MRRLTGLLLALAPLVIIASTDTAEACSFGRGVRRIAVLPGDGLVDVPTNTQIQVTYATSSEVWPFTDEVGVRAVGSTEVVPATVTREGYNWSHVVTVQPTAALAARTSYEIIDLVPDDCDLDIEQCGAAEPAVIATFTTGDAPDLVAPVTGHVGSVAWFLGASDSPGTCNYMASEIVIAPRVEAATDDHDAREHLRIRLYTAAGQPLTAALSLDHLSAAGWSVAPFTPGLLGAWCTDADVASAFNINYAAALGGTSRIVVRAVDLAGNEDASSAVIELPGCSAFDANGDGVLDPGKPSTIDSDGTTPPVDDGEDDDDDDDNDDDDDDGGLSVGCSAGPGAGPLAGLGVGLAALLRRRRRVA